MSSQLNVDTIVDKAGTSGPSLPNTTTIKMGNTSTYVSDGGAVTQNTVQSLIKQFSVFDQRGATIGANTAGDTFNTSSQSDESTAVVLVSLTSNMNNTTYPAFNSPHYDRSNANRNYPRIGAGTTCTTSSYKAVGAYVNGNVDDNVMNSALAGDLA